MHVFDVLREVRHTTGSSCNIFQGALGLLGALFALLAEQTDRINHRVSLLNFADSSFQRVVAGIVLAVGNDQ